MNKIIDFFIARKMELAMFILLVFTAAFSGFNLGFLIALVLFFGGLGIFGKPSLKWLFIILKTMVVCVFLNSFYTAYFPRSDSKSDYFWARNDQKLSSRLPDKTKVEATDDWNNSKDSQRQKFLVEYDQALKVGNTELAYNLLDKFQSKWDMEEIAASVKAKKDSIARSKEVKPDNPAQSKSETDKVLVLEKGVHTFTLKAGEKSPIIIVNGRYCAVSNNYDQFQLFYPKLRKAIPAWTSGSWPDINEFFIDSLRDQIVTITVT